MTATTAHFPKYGPFARVEVLGDPAPQGSKRHVGRGILVESSKTLKPWRATIVDAVRTEMARTSARFHQVWPLEGAVAATLVFTVRKPASAPKSRRTWPAKRPDIDKLSRAVLDALTTSGAIRDDGQITDMQSIKRYPGEGWSALDVPGVVIWLYTIGEEAS